MKKRFPYILLAVFALILGMLIVFQFSHVKFLRHFIGDVLIVIFLYACVKVIFPLLTPLKLGFGIFVYSCCIEFLQLLKLHEYFDLKTKSLIVALTLGTTFDWFDIVAYAAGSIIIMYIDYCYLNKIV